MQFDDVTSLLHAERTYRLARMPRVTGTLLSAGCAGNWYFDWVEATYGQVERHIGVEFYSPRPAALPPNVTWIENTVGDMRDVPSNSVDLAFSGQNLEHLWPSETINFYAECARVVRPGGYLVVDSPNRAVTRPLIWSHPEHTVELTPIEACRMATLAGFDVIAVHGIWLVRDPKTSHILGLEPKQLSAAATESRILLGREDPDNAMIWWIEAIRSNRECRHDKLVAEMRRIFEFAWPERTRRFVSNVGKRTDGRVTSSAAEGGALVFGPYMPLPAGEYEFSFAVKADGGLSGATLGHCDVIAGTSELFMQEFRQSASTVRAQRIAGRFRLDQPMTFAIQARVFSYGGASVTTSLPRLRGASAGKIFDATWIPYSASVRASG